MVKKSEKFDRLCHVLNENEMVDRTTRVFLNANFKTYKNTRAHNFITRTIGTEGKVTEHIIQYIKMVKDVLNENEMGDRTIVNSCNYCKCKTYSKYIVEKT